MMMREMVMAETAAMVDDLALEYRIEQLVRPDVQWAQ
jgi:hypothetical protein